MLAQNMSLLSSNKLIFSLCTLDNHIDPVKVFSIDLTSWEQKSVIVKDIDGYAIRFKNCVTITDKLILVALSWSYVILDEDMNEINNFDHRSIDPRCRLIMFLTESLLKTDLLLALSVNPFNCKNTYDADIEP